MTAPAELHLEPKIKRAKGERCCEPVVYPDVEREHTQRMAAIAKTLSDPVRCSSSTCCASTPARSASNVLPEAIHELATWLGASHHFTEEPDGDRAVRLPA